MNKRRWCKQVAWLGTANLSEMGDLALMIQQIDVG